MGIFKDETAWQKIPKTTSVLQIHTGFYCHSLKLVIELDGPVHQLEHIKANDITRQEHLEKDGFLVIRFTNDQVEDNFEKVISEILGFMEKSTNEPKE